MGTILVVRQEHSRITRSSTVFLQDNGAEILSVLLLGEVSDVVPIKLRYQRCNWDGMFQRRDEVVPTPMFEEIAW